ncbi:MAG: IS6 family transposase, partial [Alphaproteobacteria bacterium]
AENSHLVFRRRERAMKYFRKEESLQRFTSIQGAVYNHFNKERHYYTREEFKKKREAALTEWRELSIS